MSATYIYHILKPHYHRYYPHYKGLYRKVFTFKSRIFELTMPTFLPKTKLGKLSVIFIAVFFLFFFIFRILIALGQRGGETFFSNLLLSMPVLLAAIFAISAFFTGIVGIIKNKERAILVFLAAALGFFVLIFVSGEILFPH